MVVVTTAPRGRTFTACAAVFSVTRHFSRRTSFPIFPRSEGGVPLHCDDYRLLLGLLLRLLLRLLDLLLSLLLPSTLTWYGGGCGKAGCVGGAVDVVVLEPVAAAGITRRPARP